MFKANLQSTNVYVRRMEYSINIYEWKPLSYDAKNWEQFILLFLTL
jgi:hypothetical protein